MESKGEPDSGGFLGGANCAVCYFPASEPRAGAVCASGTNSEKTGNVGRFQTF